MKEAERRILQNVAEFAAFCGFVDILSGVAGLCPELVKGDEAPQTLLLVAQVHRVLRDGQWEELRATLPVFELIPTTVELDGDMLEQHSALVLDFKTEVVLQSLRTRPHNDIATFTCINAMFPRTQPKLADHRKRMTDLYLHVERKKAYLRDRADSSRGRFRKDTLLWLHRVRLMHGPCAINKVVEEIEAVRRRLEPPFNQTPPSPPSAPTSAHGDQSNQPQPFVRESPDTNAHPTTNVRPEIRVQQSETPLREEEYHRSTNEQTGKQPHPTKTPLREFSSALPQTGPSGRLVTRVEETPQSPESEFSGVGARVAVMNMQGTTATTTSPPHGSSFDHAQRSPSSAEQQPLSPPTQPSKRNDNTSEPGTPPQKKAHGQAENTVSGRKESGSRGGRGRKGTGETPQKTRSAAKSGPKTPSRPSSARKPTHTPQSTPQRYALRSKPATPVDVSSEERSGAKKRNSTPRKKRSRTPSRHGGGLNGLEEGEEGEGGERAIRPVAHMETVQEEEETVEGEGEPTEEETYLTRARTRLAHMANRLTRPVNPTRFGNRPGTNGRSLRSSGLGREGRGGGMMERIEEEGLGRVEEGGEEEEREVERQGGVMEEGEEDGNEGGEHNEEGGENGGEGVNLVLCDQCREEERAAIKQEPVEYDVAGEEEREYGQNGEEVDRKGVFGGSGRERGSSVETGGSENGGGKEGGDGSRKRRLTTEEEVGVEPPKKRKRGRPRKEESGKKLEKRKGGRQGSEGGRSRSEGGLGQGEGEENGAQDGEISDENGGVRERMEYGVEENDNLGGSEGFNGYLGVTQGEPSQLSAETVYVSLDDLGEELVHALGGSNAD